MTSTGPASSVDDPASTKCGSGSAPPPPPSQQHSVPVVIWDIRSLTTPVAVGPLDVAEGDDDDHQGGLTAGTGDRDENPHCERHAERIAELYCRRCEVPICLACASTRHLPASGHRCWDIADAVDHCRDRLAERHGELTEHYTTCLRRIEDTSAAIDSIRYETEQQETSIRRQFEELRLRLEQDHQQLIHDLEIGRNARIKTLKKYVSELQATAVKLGGQTQQLQHMVASGTAVDVISECVSSSAASGFNLLSLIEEPGDYTQPKFTRSALLEQTDNLVGQFVANPDANTPTTPTTSPLAGGPATERKRGVEWKCDNCTLVNHDTDIECRACGHAPWKQQLVSLRLPASGTALAQKQSKTVTWAGGEGPAGLDQHGRIAKWTCSVCTLVNDWNTTQCATCDTPLIADRRRHHRSTDEAFTTAMQHQSRLHTSPSAVQVSGRRTPSPGIIIGTMNQGTQTEPSVDRLQSAQKVFGRLCQAVKRVGGRTPTSSREGSPQPSPLGGATAAESTATDPTTTTSSWSALDNAMARWHCSQCGADDNTDIECEWCGFAEDRPAVRFSRCTRDSLATAIFGNHPCAPSLQ